MELFLDGLEDSVDTDLRPVSDIVNDDRDTSDDDAASSESNGGIQWHPSEHCV